MSAIQAYQRNNCLRQSGGRISAFTLIELLTVIGIMVILASILLSALGHAKQAAESTVCRNNLRQQVVGLTLYLNDFDVFPRVMTPSGPGTFGAFWMNDLAQYVGANWPEKNAKATANGWVRVGSPEKSTYACPAYNDVGGIYLPETVGAYAYNSGDRIFLFPAWPGTEGLGGEFRGGVFKGAADIRPIKEGEIVNPSQMIAFGDSGFVSADIAGKNTDAVMGYAFAPFFDMHLILRTFSTRSNMSANSPWLRESPQDAAAIRRHTGRWNMVFCDGHSECEPLSALFNWKSAAAMSHWNRDNQGHLDRLALIAP